jgi:hypothetical protein
MTSTLVATEQAPPGSRAVGRAHRQPRGANQLGWCVPRNSLPYVSVNTDNNIEDDKSWPIVVFSPVTLILVVFEWSC